MDPTKLLSYAQKAVGDKAWTVELVLRIGADLAGCVNSFPNLSGADKTQLVCQTILKMLDDAVRVEKERLVESTEKEKTIALLEECKAAVNSALPVSLELLVAASRGEILLKKVHAFCPGFFAQFPFFPSWCSSQNLSAEVLVLKSPVEYLEEMRGIVAKVEALVAEAKAFSPLRAKEQATVLVEDVTLGISQLPPTHGSPVLTLPGESVNP
jgi:hypothetical protein